MFTETFVLGVALAVDAAVATFAVSILDKNLIKSQRMMRNIILCSVFALAQFLMLWLGSQGGFILSFSKYGYIFQLVVAGVFVLIGARLIQESLKSDEFNFKWSLGGVLVLAISTSVDALAAGISLGVLPKPYLAALDVGIVTFILCFFASLLTFVTTKLPTEWLLRLAAAVFLYMGLEIIGNLFY